MSEGGESPGLTRRGLLKAVAGTGALVIAANVVDQYKNIAFESDETRRKRTGRLNEQESKELQNSGMFDVGMMFGSSVTEGTQAADKYHKTSFTRSLSILMPKTRFENDGIGESKIDKQIARIEQTTAPNDKGVFSVWEVGINNVRGDELRSEAETAFIENFKKGINLLADKSEHIFIVPPIPITDTAYKAYENWNNGDRTRNELYTQMIKQVIETSEYTDRIHLVDISKYDPNKDTHDQIHPNTRGALKIADAVMLKMYEVMEDSKSL